LQKKFLITITAVLEKTKRSACMTLIQEQAMDLIKKTPDEKYII
jgi:hypothetical protein